MPAVRQKAEIEDFRKEVKRLRQDLRNASLPLEQLQAIQDASTKLIEYAQAPLNENDAVQVPDVAEDGWRPRLGDAVWLESLKVEGVIEELNAKGEAMVQVGALKVRATTHDMRKATKLDRKIAQKEASRRRERPETEREDSITPPKSPGLELDLRGQRVEGALRSLDEYIDAADLSGLPFARIIHGKGTARCARQFGICWIATRSSSKWRRRTRTRGAQVSPLFTCPPNHAKGISCSSPLKALTGDKSTHMKATAAFLRARGVDVLRRARAGWHGNRRANSHGLAGSQEQVHEPFSGIVAV
jgi:DNA mismatch repair protein MutS2